jgi:hypothetical protein
MGCLYRPPPAHAHAQAQPAQAQAQLLPPLRELPLLAEGLLSAVGRIAAAIPPIVVSAHPAKEAETSPKVVVDPPPPVEADDFPPPLLVRACRAQLGQ